MRVITAVHFSRSDPLPLPIHVVELPIPTTPHHAHDQNREQRTSPIQGTEDTASCHSCYPSTCLYRAGMT